MVTGVVIMFSIALALFLIVGLPSLNQGHSIPKTKVSVFVILDFYFRFLVEGQQVASL